MQKREILEVKAFFLKSGKLDRENSICIEEWELIPEKRVKPSDRVLEQLQYIKKLRKENRLTELPIDNTRTIEYTIGELSNQKLRKKNRQKQKIQLTTTI